MKFLIEVEAPDGYEDVDPQLCAEDMLKDVNQCWRWSLVESGQPSAALAQRLLAHAELHEAHVQDDDQRQWAADLREAARIIATHPSPADEAVQLLKEIKAWDVSHLLMIPHHLRVRIQAAIDAAIAQRGEV